MYCGPTCVCLYFYCASLCLFHFKYVIKSLCWHIQRKNLLKIDHTYSLTTSSLITTPPPNGDMLFKMCDMCNTHTHTYQRHSKKAPRTDCLLLKKGMLYPVRVSGARVDKYLPVIKVTCWSDSYSPTHMVQNLLGQVHSGTV